MLTATVVGAAMQIDFDRNLPFDIENSFPICMWRSGGIPLVLLAGLPFSLTLLTILLAHEFGHYLAALYHRVDASLPYFMPSPFLGTFGAFIRVRSPIYSKRVLFDIGISGPLAGFVFLLPALAVGLAFSKVIPGIAHQGSLQFGAPGLEWLLRNAIFPGRAGRRHLPAPGGAGGLDRDVRHGAEPAAHRPVGRRAHPVLLLSRSATALVSKVLCVPDAAAVESFWWGWVFWAAGAAAGWDAATRRSTTPPT